MYIIIIHEWKLVLNSWSIVLHVTFKQESYFINKTISSTKLPSPTQSFKKGYEEVCLKLLSKVKHFIFVFTIKMWQNDKICFLKIFTWHPKKDQNFNCAFEDDKWRVFPNTFRPVYLFRLADWILWITLFLNSCSQESYLVKSLHIVFWNLKRKGI